MKALILAGTREHPDVAMADMPEPEAAPGQLLVAPLAAGVTAMEPHWKPNWLTADGKHRTGRIVLGHEFSGVVVDRGAGVEGFPVGQRVFGMIDPWRDGAIAERVNVLPDEVIALPYRLDASAAATMPLAGLTAWQALMIHGRLAKGETILIHGGAGGVGSFAIQIARWAGAHVVTTADAKDVDFCRELGADRVIDFRTQRFEDHAGPVDLVFDMIGGEVQERSWSVLTRGGPLVTIAGETEDAPDQKRAAAAGISAMFFIVQMDREQLSTLRDLTLRGDVVPIVGRRIDLDDAAKAFAPDHHGDGRGKTVIMMD